MTKKEDIYKLKLGLIIFWSLTLVAFLVPEFGKWALLVLSAILTISFAQEAK